MQEFLTAYGRMRDFQKKNIEQPSGHTALLKQYYEELTDKHFKQIMKHLVSTPLDEMSLQQLLECDSLY